VRKNLLTYPHQEGDNTMMTKTAIRQLNLEGFENFRGLDKYYYKKESAWKSMLFKTNPINFN